MWKFTQCAMLTQMGRESRREGIYICMHIRQSLCCTVDTNAALGRSCGGAGLVAQSCPTLCDPVDSSPPGSSVRGILQARVLEWVAMPSPVKQLYLNKNE